MLPGSGQLRLCSDTPAGGGGGEVGAAPLEQRVAIPAGPLRHFVYHVPARRQFLAPAPQPEDSAQVSCIAACHQLHIHDCAVHISLSDDASRRDCVSTCCCETSVERQTVKSHISNRTTLRRWRGCTQRFLARRPTAARAASSPQNCRRRAAHCQQAPRRAARCFWSQSVVATTCDIVNRTGHTTCLTIGASTLDAWQIRQICMT